MTLIDTTQQPLPSDGRAITEVLWQRWRADLDRYDGRDTAVSDPHERRLVEFSLTATALLIAAVPADCIDDLRAKTLIAAWLRQTNPGDHTLAMVERAITADMDGLQPADDLGI